MDSLLNKNITYGALDRVLVALGFHETTYQTHRLYEKKEAGAMIILPPNIQMDKPAHAVHLLTARHTVAGMGIADEAEFENLLTKSHEPKPHLTAATNGHVPRRSRPAKSRVPMPAVPIDAG